MSQGAIVVTTAEQLTEIVRAAVQAALRDRPVADEYIDKHTAHTVGLSASGFVGHCRAGRFAVELRGRRYVARRADVLAWLAASQRPKAASAEPAANPIEAALQSGRLALVRRT
jgi:preprotein translocase subunit Sss1